jgi:hypothetical protein
MEEHNCIGCGASETVYLERCRICHRYFCGECAWRASSGLRFCGERCNEIFVFGDQDDEDDQYIDES